MTEKQLNAVALYRLVSIADNSGPQFFDDPQCLNRLFGRKTLSKSERHLLALVRSIVEPVANGVR